MHYKNLGKMESIIKCKPNVRQMYDAAGGLTVSVADHKVAWLSNLPEQEMRRAMLPLDVILKPSLLSECFGRSYA